MAQYLLHGTLMVTIYKAQNLVMEKRKSGGAPAFIRKFIEGTEETLGVGKGYTKLYATVDLGDTRVGRTRRVTGQPRDPVWNESFRIYCAHTVSEVRISIKDAAIVGTVVVGRARIPAYDLIAGRKIDDWYRLYNERHEIVKDAKIRFRLQFVEASRDPNWGKGIRDPQFPGVPYCYFGQHKGCRVTLYQDAHMSDEFLPSIYLAKRQVYQPTRCWEDIFEAINNAKHLIYITGWSVYTEITLCRDPQRKVPGDKGLTLGELLKQKADQGVRVNLLVWDDRTSNLFNKGGLMGTHDEDTMIYFQGTKVNCVLCPRIADSSLTALQTATTGALFTHHQKSVTVDAAPVVPSHGRGNSTTPSGRRIVSFVGGIDLCNGRYDNQKHSLFHTLNNVNSKDFHQANLNGASLEFGGPREPWHDIHSRLEGPIAWDVLFNFDQRWRKQAGEHREKLLLPIQELALNQTPITAEDDPETWNVQLFRSIDAGAAFGFPNDPADAAKQGLVSGRDNTVDRSIQDAYIHAIRRAKNFIYIENQYFLGSSYGWESKKDAGANHLIPLELTRKIVSKIEAGQPFTVYVVVPMWPEGIPESASVQAILDWQTRTLRMMYKEIAVALEAKKIYDRHPRDYLAFFCLGNRETVSPRDYVPTKTPTDSNYKSAQEHRRFMIYVHAKMMIVDDEYILLGSANINQRSMDGARDSEIAMGAYQPNYLVAKKGAFGQIHGFRMSLWYEHTGFLDQAYMQPWTPECMRKIQHRGDQLWKLFVQEEIVNLPGQLLTYPIYVGRDGSVSELQGFTYFPDTKAKVLGTVSDFLPEVLTT